MIKTTKPNGLYVHYIYVDKNYRSIVINIGSYLFLIRTFWFIPVYFKKFKNATVVCRNAYPNFNVIKSILSNKKENIRNKYDRIKQGRVFLVEESSYIALEVVPEDFVYYIKKGKVYTSYYQLAFNSYLSSKGHEGNKLTIIRHAK